MLTISLTALDIIQYINFLTISELEIILSSTVTANLNSLFEFVDTQKKLSYKAVYTGIETKKMHF